MGVIDEVKERLDIVEVVSRYVPLKKAGRNYKGLCPFHTEKTPSFVVFPETGTWHCFGACGTGGDVYGFIMKRENLDFAEALRMLAPMAGVSLEEPHGPGRSEEEQQRKRLLELTAAAVAFFQRQLQSEAGKRASDYLAQRQLTPETAASFQLGYAPDSWDALLRHLRGLGYTPAEIEAAGLILAGREGTHYDRFRDRLMIPIRNVRGQAIAFGARLLPGGKEQPDRPQPKYLNSPQTILFDKGQELFGLYEGRQAIRAADSAIIVEGYMDVMAAHQHGIGNVVATMGTALTEAQLKRLKRFTSRFVLALDADTAGQAATLRGVQQAREALDHTMVPVPTAGGLIRFEGRLDAQLQIMTLPAGQDPDQVIRSDPDLWARLVAEAKPVADHYLSLATAELDLTSAKGKAEAVRRLVPLIREIGDDVERAHYVQKLARLVRVDEQIVQSQVMQPAQPGSRQRPASRQEVAVPPDEERRLELSGHCLAQILLRPELLAAMDARCATLQMPSLATEDFGDVVDQTIFVVLLDHLPSDQHWDPQALRQWLEPPLHARLEALLTYGATLPALSVSEAASDLVNATLRLRLGRLRQRLADLQALLQQAQDEGDRRAVEEYKDLVQGHTAAMGRLQQMLTTRAWNNRKRTA